MSFRILMIAPTSFFGDYGCHVRILEETRALQKLGHHVRIVTYPRGRDLPDIEIERTMPIPWRVNYEVGSSRHKIGLDVFLTTRVLRVIRRYKPDLIHAHLHEGALIGSLGARIFNKPLVFDFQGGLTAEMVDHHFINPRGRWFRALRSLEQWIDHRPATIFTSAAYQAQLLRDEFQVPPQKIVHIPDAVNPDWFTPPGDASIADRNQLKTKTLGIPAQRPVVVYLGLLADYQGVGALLDAAARLIARGGEAHFLIMGYPSADRYREYARQLGIADRVSFPGRIAYEDAPRWLSVGDIAVAPKLSATEGNGKILNYMAVGLPVVAFDNPVARDYLGDDGVYAPPGDVKALAATIASLLQDPPRARAQGFRLRARAAEKFSWDQSARKIEQVYSALLHGETNLNPQTRDAPGAAPLKSPQSESDPSS